MVLVLLAAGTGDLLALLLWRTCTFNLCHADAGVEAV